MDKKSNGGFVKVWHPSHGSVVLSVEALVLSSAAVVASLADVPGFVADKFLDEWPTDVGILVAELCMSCLWERGTGGYNIDQPLLDVLTEAGLRTIRTESEE